MMMFTDGLATNEDLEVILIHTPLIPDRWVFGIKGGVWRPPEGDRSLGSLDFQNACEAHSGLVPSG